MPAKGRWMRGALDDAEEVDVRVVRREVEDDGARAAVQPRIALQEREQRDGRRAIIREQDVVAASRIRLHESVGALTRLVLIAAVVRPPAQHARS